MSNFGLSLSHWLATSFFPHIVMDDSDNIWNTNLVIASLSLYAVKAKCYTIVFCSLTLTRRHSRHNTISMTHVDASYLIISLTTVSTSAASRALLHVMTSSLRSAFTVSFRRRRRCVCVVGQTSCLSQLISGRTSPDTCSRPPTGRPRRQPPRSGAVEHVVYLMTVCPRTPRYHTVRLRCSSALSARL